MKENGYAILYKDNAMVHILPAGTDIGEMEFYLEVDNVEQVWQSIKDKLGRIKAKEPFDREEYRTREIKVSAGKTIFFKLFLFKGRNSKEHCSLFSCYL